MSKRSHFRLISALAALTVLPASLALVPDSRVSALSLHSPSVPGDILVNGDFEQGPGVGWVESNNCSEIIQDILAHSGLWSAHPIPCYNDSAMIEQLVTIPGNASLTFWKMSLGREAQPEVFGKLVTELWSPDNQTRLATLDSWPGGVDGVWYQKTVDLSAYAGQRVNLRFAVVGCPGFFCPELYYVDDVSLVGDAMHVADISPFYREIGNGYLVGSIFSIQDATGAPLVGVVAIIQLTLPDGQSAVQPAISGLDGTLRGVHLFSQTGTYTFKVLHLHKAGWVYDVAANVETSDSVTIP